MPTYHDQERLLNRPLSELTPHERKQLETLKAFFTPMSHEECEALLQQQNAAERRAGPQRFK